MDRIRVRSLQWAVGSFFALLGTLVLIAPHQFNFISSPVIQETMYIWSTALLLVGISLIGITLLSPPWPWIVKVIHLFSAIFLFALAAAFWRTGAWVVPANYAILGLGLLFSMFLPRAWRRDSRPVSSDLFTALIGANALLTGILLTFGSSLENSTPIFQFTFVSRYFFGLSFSVTGIWLLAAELYRFRADFTGTNHPLQPAWVRLSNPWANWSMSANFAIFILVTTLPSHLWVAVAYFGVMATILAFLSRIENSLTLFPPNSLRVRTAVVLSAAASVPLFFTFLWNGFQEEGFIRRTSLIQHEAEALSLAKDAEIHLRGHLSPLQALATHEDLLSLSAEEQVRHLLVFSEAFPEFEAFTLYDGNGIPRASSDRRWMSTSMAGHPDFEQVRNKLEPGLRTVISPVLERLVLRYSLPLLDGGGGFQGMVVSEMEMAPLTNELRIHGNGTLKSVYLVDGEGRVIVHPYADSVIAFQDQAAAPVIEALNESESASGALTFRSNGGEFLAGYARIPEFGWGVIVNQPVSTALIGVYNSRDLAFGLLLFFFLVTSAAGLFIARWMTRPLTALSQAVGGLSEGESTVPLPRTDFVEIQQLVAAFGDLRVRLASRTAERESALAKLRKARNELEQRVEKRTAELRGVNQQLEITNQELHLAKEDLEVELAEREELEKRLAYQALVLENVHDAVIATDENSRITSWNLGAEFMYGWRADEVLGRGVDEILQAEWSKENGHVSFFVESGDSLGDVLHYRRDGRPVYVAGNTITLLKPEGGIGGYVATNHDVTARKLAEQALQESERRLRTVLEYLPAGVWLTDSRGKIVYGNPAAIEIWGGVRFIGMDAVQVEKAWWADTGQPVRPGELASERALKDGETRLNEVIEIEGFDGTRKVIRNSAVPILDPQKNVLGTVILDEDITERRKAEVALAESEARERSRAAELEALMDAVPAVVQVARDPECQEIIGNRFSYNLLRLPYGSNQSLSCEENGEQAGYRLFDEDVELQTHELPMQIAASRGVEVNDVRQKVIFENGDYRYIFGNVAPLLDDQGQPRGAVGAFTDITRMVEAERALNEYAARLERSNQDLEDFAFIASHDLQEPLRKIKAFSDLLQLNYGQMLGEEGCDFLDRMRDASVRMKEMIDDLMSYSRVASQPRAYEEVALNDVVRRVIADLEVSLVQTGGQVLFEDLPTIIADPVHMHQLLLNLVSNGLKFSRTGYSPVVKVSALIVPAQASGIDPAQAKPASLQIRVEDNGIGFEEKFVDRIFQPFQRLHGRSQYPGSGIGLAICRKIVEQNSGSISAHSTPGLGSTFLVTLPQETPQSGSGA